VENRHCADEGPYPDNDAYDTQNYRDQIFHLGSVFLIAEKGHARDESQWLAVARISFPMDCQSPRWDRASLNRDVLTLCARPHAERSNPSGHPSDADASRSRNLVRPAQRTARR
jgi:hypothetical protein